MSKMCGESGVYLLRRPFLLHSKVAQSFITAGSVPLVWCNKTPPSEPSNRSESLCHTTFQLRHALNQASRTFPKAAIAF